MFIGRISEINQLQEQLNRNEGRLAVVYGRRRVGKTSLIDKAFENETVWKFDGLEGQSSRQQIAHFFYTLKMYAGNESTNNLSPKTASWQDVFLLLERSLPRKRIVVVFDEFQWLVGMRSQAVGIFKWAWDNYFSKRPNCCFVVCGSISSFIVRRVIKSVALYGRIHCEIPLNPLTFEEVSGLLVNGGSILQKLETYMVFGGIPYYVNELSLKESLVQNLQRLAFTPHGFFLNEYQRLFISHFAKKPHYEQVMRFIAHTPHQAYENIAKSLKMKTGGTYSKIIEDLALAGFIEIYKPVDKNPRSKLLQIRMLDEFLHFYYFFIEQNRTAIDDGTLKPFELLTGPRFAQWRGYAFERLCRKQAKAIAAALGFSGIRFEHGSWFRRDKGNGAQIDLLFVRRDNVLTVCEIKWALSEAAHTVVDEFEKKITVLSGYFSRPIQKVLVVATKSDVSDTIASYFDTVLFAENVMMRNI